MRVDKSSVKLNKVLISIGKQTGTYMRNKNEIERIGFTNFDQLLKAGQIACIVIEILCEFVPNKDNCLKIVCSYYFLDPVGKILGCHCKRLNLAFFRNFEDLFHQSVESKIRICIELMKNIINGITAEKIRITTPYIDAKALLVFGIGKVTNDRIFQRI